MDLSRTLVILVVAVLVVLSGVGASGVGAQSDPAWERDVPDSAWKQDVPKSAWKQDVPKSAWKQDAPNSAWKQDVPKSAWERDDPAWDTSAPNSAWEPSDPNSAWEAATLADLRTLADRYNAALDRGASPQISGERVTLRVHSTAVGEEEVAHQQVYRFTVGGDGHIRDVGTGEHPDATLVLSTSRGTVGHLATAPNPVVAFDSVFGRHGDVAGPNVAPDGDGFAYDVPSSVVLQLGIDEEGTEEDPNPRLSVTGEGAGENTGRTARLLDLQGHRPVVRTLEAGDLDGDGRPDVVVPGHDGEWTVQHVDAVRKSAARQDDSTTARGSDPVVTWTLEVRVNRWEAAITPSDGDDCDDADPLVSPDGVVRCDGSIVLGAGSDDAYDPTTALLFLATSTGGMALADLGKPVADRSGTLCGARERGQRTGCGPLRLATGGADGHVTVLEAHARPDGGLVVAKEIDKCSPKLATACLVDPAVGDVQSIPISGDGGAASLYLVDHHPERVDPVSATGVGIVNGVKWAVVSVLRGLGLF